MSQSASHRIQIRVQGALGPTWFDLFADLEVTPEPDGTTRITGELADQAALHGLLAVIRDTGLSLISVETVATVATLPPASRTGG